MLYGAIWIHANQSQTEHGQIEQHIKDIQENIENNNKTFTEKNDIIIQKIEEYDDKITSKM